MVVDEYAIYTVFDFVWIFNKKNFWFDFNRIDKGKIKLKLIICVDTQLIYVQPYSYDTP